MRQSLTLILSAVLVSSTLVQGRRGLFPRAVEYDIEECYGEDWQNDLIARFTGVFFGDFTTGGGTDILGGLAVEGNFHAPNYVVNANHGADCSATGSLNSYGLVVGGITTTSNTQVHGSAFLSQGGTVDEVKQQNSGCYVTADEGTGIFDFALVKELAITSSEDFERLTPTAILNADGTITYLRDGLELYEVIDFHSCAGPICSQTPAVESDPDAILFNKGNWNGVQGSVIDPAKTYVWNVPVLNGDTIEFNTNNPTLGFNPCRLIINVFPVDSSGNFLPDGEFTLIRRTANQLGAFTLAPRGHIIDGNVGAFAGNIVGLDYTWENLGSGVEIHDFHAAGGACDYYLGCRPVHVTTTPTAGPTPSTRSSTSISMSTTHSTVSWSIPIFYFSTSDSSTSDSSTSDSCTPQTDTVTTTETQYILSTDTVTETAAQVTVTSTSTTSVFITDCATDSLPIISSDSCTADHTVTETIIDPYHCDDHKHHHKKHKGHHHGPDEECNEEDEEEDDDEYEHDYDGDYEDDDDYEEKGEDKDDEDKDYK
ncbi:hypothetical protein MBANPS3_005303 [Mucor bainieri]